ncbi:hypothetical protein [Rathayibacter sp. VKM Ac-2805]|uniref:hypothetical protein n=1 Tax=Rathayibacter sp. VKM Ac-2805 TaxID=2609258 RepID=UPI0013204E62|nr:hypothetical protein [Rathayibacter sp. VKM Ac-2805]QHC73776.1 hypothetical protein GSU40_08865 [Rathayibacter sp. VKM Ac-2805]
MGVVTVPQANPNDELTDTLINQGPNAIAAAVNGNLDDANISALSGSKISAGTLTAAAADTNSNPETRQSETVGNIVSSGLIWSQTSGLNGTMTSGVAYVAGKRLPVPAVASYGFAASRDTYIYVDNTGNVQYNPQALGAARPATPANNVLVSKVTTSAGAVTAVSDQRNTTLTDAWRSWTPTWTDLTIGNATVDFRFVVIGKTVHIRGKLIFGTTSSFTPSSGLSFTAPLDYSRPTTSASRSAISASRTRALLPTTAWCASTTRPAPASSSSASSARVLRTRISPASRPQCR